MKHALVILLILTVAAGSCLAGNTGFVQIDGTAFELNGQRYLYAGVNYWYGMNLASAGAGGDRERLCRELDALRFLGITNLRIMVGSEGPDTEPWRIVPSLQTAPGVYNTDVLDGLDFLLSEMDERGMRAVACLTNFWHWSGGMAQYVNWSGGGPIPYPPPESGGDWNVFQDYASDFYSNAGAMEDLRDHIAFLIGRLNPHTGLLYRGDPTIMAWELANEPRGFHNNAAAFNTWLDDTAAHIKSLDPNHLVTTGCEGDTPWPSWNGLDFTDNHDGPDIDYTTIHIWPQNWEWFDPSNPEATFPSALATAEDYLSTHLGEAVLLSKPLVLEEFGLARDGGSYDPSASVVWRDSLLSSLYGLLETSAQGGGPACGDNVWAWAGEGRPSAPFGGYWNPGEQWVGDPPHEHQGWYSIYDSDSTTLSTLAAHAYELCSIAHATSIGDGALPSDVRQGSLSVFPSPSISPATVVADFPHRNPNRRIDVVDVGGRVLWSCDAAARHLTFSWPRSGVHLPSGIYFVIVAGEVPPLTAKMVYIHSTR
jgi:mannan endo-1,4-beta-mannosidase